MANYLFKLASIALLTFIAVLVYNMATKPPGCSKAGWLGTTFNSKWDI